MKTLTSLLLTLFAVAGLRAADAIPYPLTTCIVSGEKLGEMGKPYVFVKDGQEIKFCCKDCLKDFNKEPEKFLKQIAEKAKK